MKSQFQAASRESQVIYGTQNLRLATCDSAPRNLQRGFTLIELIVAITIVVILAAVLLERVWFYQEQAEKTVMVGVAGTIQSALVMQYGRFLVRGMESGVAALEAENPMKWLSKQPHNYAGEFYDPTPDSVAHGNWMFDLKAHELIYVLNRAEYFIPGKDGKKWIRYRVSLKYAPAFKTPDHAADGSKLEGALFGPVAPYRWFD